ncbi:MAG: SigE family RNA polymerase sigma factor [Terracoccus sp.]
MRQQDDDYVEWVTARQAGLLRFAYLLTGDPHSAQDLVQTALAKAYLKWDTVRVETSRGAWVRRIIVNEQASAWRRPWRRHEVVNTPYLEFVDLGEASTGSTLGERRRLVAARGSRSEERSSGSFDSDLWGVVCSLPPRQRAAVVLRYYEELSERETADVLGCSLGNVKSQTHRALAALRIKLEEVTA